jgi:benzylsuccinate CoA-transferase BbsE subunit
MVFAGLLGQYRAVEIGDLAGVFCGKILADLGCEVLHIEPPQGDPLRAEPPLVPWDGVEISANWLAYNTSKRSVALDVADSAGRSVLDRLIDNADLVIASGSVAWFDSLGLRPRDLRAQRPKLVAVAITPFGFEGPYRDYLLSDLVAQSAGGFTHINGDRDRPPVRITEEQTWPHTGSQAAFAGMAALYSAQATGVGEGIDLSVQEAIVATLVDIVPWWQLEHRSPERSARTRMGRDILIRNLWPCTDGFVTYRVSFGQGMGNRNLRLVEWMEEEGMAGDLLSVPWEYTSTLEMTQEQVNGWQATMEAFFATKTKAELYAGALERRIMLFPVLELSDMLRDRQLAERSFLRTFADTTGRSVQLPGAFFRAVAGADPVPSFPPCVGEYTDEALIRLAGCSSKEIQSLRSAGVIA